MCPWVIIKFNISRTAFEIFWDIHDGKDKGLVISLLNEIFSFSEGRKCLFNDALNTLYLRLYGIIRHMLKDN